MEDNIYKYFLYFSLLLTLAGCTTNENTENQTETEEPTEETTETENEVAESEEDAETGETREPLTDTGYRFNDHSEFMEELISNEDDIREQWEADTYSAESPLVVVDPYGIAPLGALVMFETDEPMTVSYHVEGETEDTTISNTIDGENTVHELPVLGLYAGVENTVRLELEDEEGNITEEQVQIETEAIPEGYYDLELVESQPEEMHPGLTFLNTSAGEYTAVDSQGDIRFMLKPWMANNVEHLENGNFVINLRREHDEQDGTGIIYDQIVELDFLGRPYNSYVFELDNYSGAFPFDHDIIELENGNMLALVHDSQSEFVEDGMIEFDLDTGDIYQVTDFKELFPSDYYEDYQYQGEDSYDWLHHNSIHQTADGESLLVSGRNHDMVIKMSYPEEEIEWISVIDDNWEETTRPPEEYMLEPIGDVKFHMAHHAVEEMPDQDGNEDTMDIMLFDNNRMIMRGHEEESEKYSRAVQYRINEVDMTIEEIWSYGEERGEASFTDIVSDADYLEETNNVLVDFGRAYDENDDAVSHIVEVDKDTNEVVFEYHVTQTQRSDRRQIYRADRLPLYTEDYEYNSILEN